MSEIEKIKVQVDRLVSVHRVADLTADYGQYGALERELALIKVKGTVNKRLDALRLAEAFDAQTVDASLDSFVFQITGRTREIDRFINLMASVGLTEVSRTGVNVKYVYQISAQGSHTHKDLKLGIAKSAEDEDK